MSEFSFGDCYILFVPIIRNKNLRGVFLQDVQEKSKETYLENYSLKIVVLSCITPDILKNMENGNCECM